MKVGAINRRLYFRPLALLSLCSAVLLVVLLMLGVWQLRRAEWKKSLLSEIGAEAAMPEPRSVAEAVCRDESRSFSSELIAWPSERVSLRVYGLDVQGRAGWREFVIIAGPSCLGSALLAERSFLPEQGDRTEIMSKRLRWTAWPDRAGFAPANAPAANEWYWFDPVAMKAALDTEFVTDRLLQSADHVSLEQVRTPLARHYGYAVSWFGMAVALIVIYIIYHHRAGRLKLYGRDI